MLEVLRSLNCECRTDFPSTLTRFWLYLASESCRYTDVLSCISLLMTFRQPYAPMIIFFSNCSPMLLCIIVFRLSSPVSNCSTTESDIKDSLIVGSLVFVFCFFKDLVRTRRSYCNISDSRQFSSSSFFLTCILILFIITAADASILL